MEELRIGIGLEIFHHDGEGQMLPIVLVNAARQRGGSADVPRFPPNHAMVKCLALESVGKRS